MVQNGRAGTKVGEDLEFRILGPLEVSAAGKMLPLGGAKQRALLSILLINANRVVASDRLIELLWGEEPPDTAHNALQVYVSQFRKLLEPGHRQDAPYQILVSQPPGYALRVEASRLDLGRFEQLVEEARQAAVTGKRERAAALLRDALALWRGAALADVAEQPFAVAERTRLTERRWRTLEERIDVDLALGRHADLVGELEALAAEHPLRERLCGQLMLALYRSGRQAEASEVYYRTRQRLVDELGMEPGGDLQKLLKEILTQAPGLNWVPADGKGLQTEGPTLPPGPVFRFDGATLAITLPKSLVGRPSRDGTIRPDLDLTAVDPQKTVSRRHAELAYRDDAMFIRDLTSVNGTTVNGRRLRPDEWSPLQHGDRLTFGTVSAEFILPEGFVWRDWLDATVLAEAAAPSIASPSGEGEGGGR